MGKERLGFVHLLKKGLVEHGTQAELLLPESIKMRFDYRDDSLKFCFPKQAKAS